MKNFNEKTRDLIGPDAPICLICRMVGRSDSALDLRFVTVMASTLVNAFGGQAKLLIGTLCEQHQNSLFMLLVDGAMSIGDAGVIRMMRDLLRSLGRSEKEIAETEDCIARLLADKH